MNRLIHFIARLYPRWWRERYGAEFEALLAEDAATLRAAVDVFAGAMLMRIRTFAEGEPLPAGDSRVLAPLIRNWWLLAFSGPVQAAISVICLVMQSSHEVLTFHAWNQLIAVQGYLELMAGITAGAAGLMNSNGHKSWPLILQGFAFTCLGIISAALTHFPIPLSAIAVLVMLMALSVAMLASRIARYLPSRPGLPQSHAAGFVWITASVFIAVLLALSLRWIRVEPGSHLDLFWLGSYFAFSAVCMLGLGLQLHAKALRRRIR